MKVLSLAIFSAVLFSAAATAAEPKIASLDAAACMEGPLAQFGRYVGDWKIDDEQLARDGSAWGPGKGARWIFKCVGDGTAVQDYWFPNAGGFGTNLRKYNPDTKKWEIVWAASSAKPLTQISATANEEGNVIMEILSPKQDPPRRITFYKPHDKGWNWAQEWSFDGGKTWVEVYRIKATPWQAAAKN